LQRYCVSFILPAKAADIQDATGRSVTIPDRIERVMPAGPPAPTVLYVLAPAKMIGWSAAPRPNEREFMLPATRDLPELGRLTGRGDTANVEVCSRPSPISFSTSAAHGLREPPRSGCRQTLMGLGSRVSLAVALALTVISPALCQKHQSSKGWELYSWSEAGEWRFSLLYGTNRIKFCSEIKHPSETMTLDQAENVMRTLAAFEYLSWRGPEFFGQPDDCGVAYPPPDIVARVRLLARQLDLRQSDSAPASAK
jgi:hypothetical protein